MIEELRIKNLGVVEDTALVLKPGMTALTGETGAGKTMIVEAIRLLTGGKADPNMARTGTTEASVQARMLRIDEDLEVETIVSRVIPSSGRGRAYVDDSMVSASALADMVGSVVDLHGQHGFHSLFSVKAQRDALDRYANTNVKALRGARERITDIEGQIRDLAGDDSSREREIDLLRYQLEELRNAELSNPNESEELKTEEDQLADVDSLRLAVESARNALDTADTSAVQRLSDAIAALQGKELFASITALLETTVAQLNEANLDLSSIAERITDDPERLANVQQRRHLLRTVERKYGPTLADAIAFEDEISKRLELLSGHDEALDRLHEQLDAARETLRSVEAKTAKVRKTAAPKLAKDVELRLASLALKGARFVIDVSGAGGDDVSFLLGANAGIDVAPIAKAASGGELARAMLALRLALNEATATDGGPTTLVFDEVDAGVGGEAAVAVGRALAELGAGNSRQIIVVTHLPQVAAFADHQMHVSKSTKSGKTVAEVREVEGEEREVELARMLAGRPDSKAGREHARELLDAATSKTRSKRTKR